MMRSAVFKSFCFSIVVALSLLCFSVEIRPDISKVLYKLELLKPTITDPTGFLRKSFFLIGVAYLCPIISLPIGLFFIKYCILNLTLNVMLKYNGPSFLLHLFYFLGARADAQLLRKACMEKNSQLALQCLKYGADPQKATFRFFSGTDEYKGDRYYTNVLQLACDNGDIDLIKALIERGANTNDTDQYGRRPINFANNKDVLEFLITDHHALIGYTKPSMQFFKNQSYLSRSFVRALEAIVAHDIFVPHEDIDILFTYLNDAISDHIANALPRTHSEKDQKWIRIFFECLFSAGNYEDWQEWMNPLYTILQRHFDSEKRWKLFYLLRSLEKERFGCITKFSDRWISVIINNNDIDCLSHIVTDISNLEKIEMDDSHYGNLCFRHACEKNKADVVSYFYKNSAKWNCDQNVIQNVIWHKAVFYSKPCLLRLLEESESALTDLQRKNWNKQTVFYAAVTHKKIDNLKDIACIELHKDFLQQELLNALDIQETSKLKDFISFCVKNGADITDAKQKAKEKHLTNIEESISTAALSLSIYQAFTSEKL